MGTSFWLKWFMVELLLFKVTRLHRLDGFLGAGPHRIGAKKVVSVTTTHRSGTERYRNGLKTNVFHNGMNCQRPGANGCRLQLISGWLKTTSLSVRVMWL